MTETTVVSARPDAQALKQAAQQQKKRATAAIHTAKQQVGGATRKAAGSVKPVIGRIALVVLALVICVIPAIFVNNVIGYLPIIALVSILIISFVYLQVLARSFTYSEASLVPSCERGSQIDFVLGFKNTSPLVFLRLEPFIYISDLFDEIDTVTKVGLTLMPFEDKEFHFQAEFSHIGTYSAGIQKIVINDLLGLFYRTVKNPNRHQVEVMPRMFDVDSLPLSSEASSDSRRPRQALTIDDLDYAGVREYTWGDPIKTIHWKLSARNTSGDYLTRLFETFNNPGLTIILDTSAPHYDSESLMCLYDTLVESALSVNQFAVTQGIDPVIFFRNRYGEDAAARINSLSDYPELTSALPRIAPGSGDEAIELLRREVNTLHGQENVLFCTSQVNEEIITLLVSVKLHKRTPILVLAIPPAFDDQEAKEFVRPLRRLDDAQISYYTLTSAASLGVVVESGTAEEE